MSGGKGICGINLRGVAGIGELLLPGDHASHFWNEDEPENGWFTLNGKNVDVKNEKEFARFLKMRAFE